MPAVLIVDDDLGTREGFKDILRSENGFDVATAATGREGLALARRQTFNAILIDLHLPDISGIDVLRDILATDPDVPIVIMTAFGTMTSAIEALKLGALDYVSKPLVGDDLVGVVHHAIAQKRNAISHVRSALFRLEHQRPRERSLSPRVAAALDAIGRRCAEPNFSLTVLARDVGVSNAHLCRILKLETGRGFRAHLHRNRTRRAKTLLTTTTLSMKEIAFDVGYRTTSALDHHFNRLCGSSPSSYRRTAFAPGDAPS